MPSLSGGSPLGGCSPLGGFSPLGGCPLDPASSSKQQTEERKALYAASGAEADLCSVGGANSTKSSTRAVGYEGRTY